MIARQQGMIERSYLIWSCGVLINFHQFSIKTLFNILLYSVDNCKFFYSFNHLFLSCS